MLLVAQAEERYLNIYLNAHPSEDLDDDYQAISSIVEEPEVPYGQAYVRLLARRGKIDAHNECKTWFTNKKAIKNYIENRERERKLN